MTKSRLRWSVCFVAFLAVLYFAAGRRLLELLSDTCVDCGTAQFKVGQIFVVGNEVIPDEVIRAELGFYPGQLACLAQLQAAEIRLARRGLFHVDPESGEMPSVRTVRDHPSDGYFDIVVQVKELPDAWGCLIPSPFLWGAAGMTGLAVIALWRTWRLSMRDKE